MTWVQSSDLDSKAGLRTRCCQKLEDMIQQLQVGLVGAGGALGTLLPSLAFYKSWDQNQLRPRAPCLAQSWASSLPALSISGDFPVQVEVTGGVWPWVLSQGQPWDLLVKGGAAPALG